MNPGATALTVIVRLANSRAHPGEQENQRHPAAARRLDVGAHFDENIREFQRDGDTDHGINGRVHAVFRWRGDQVLAADNRTDGMDAARLILEKRAGDALPNVVDGQGFFLRAAGNAARWFHAIEQSRIAKLQQGRVETRSEFRLPLFGQCADPAGKKLGFEEAERNQLAAAGSATGAAGDAEAFALRNLGSAVNNVAAQVLQDGQNLGEIGFPRRHHSRCIETARTDVECEIDLNGCGIVHVRQYIEG